MAKNPQPSQHDPTPDERDERVKVDGVSEEEALRILLGAPADRELADEERRGPGEGGPTCAGYVVDDRDDRDDPDETDEPGHLRERPA